jgi:hypothetical protein
MTAVLAQPGAIAAKCLELSPHRSVEVSVNTIPLQTIPFPPGRNGLRLGGDLTNKLNADPEHKRTKKSAIISLREGWQRGCTGMVDFL